MMLHTLIIPIILFFSFDASQYKKYAQIVKFDSHFSKYSKRYFGPGFDWHYFKAQAIAESRLDANAKSKVGALGIMQIMPKTFDEIKKQHPDIAGSRIHPKWNIAAGIRYNRQIWKKWSPKRTIKDKINFMFASYNTGRGNIIKAQKIAIKQGLDPDQWKSIEKTLAKVTGKHSRETLYYVVKINHIKEVLK